MVAMVEHPSKVGIVRGGHQLLKGEGGREEGGR